VIDVALVTCSEFPNLGRDDALLLPALAQRGIHARPVPWDDPAMNWSIPKLSVIRSTWDYHHRLTEFLAWAERAAALCSLWNPLEIIRWNTHKSYLRDLEQRGIPIVPTVWLAHGTYADLARLMADHSWQTVVVKPAVSASAYATLLVTEETIDQGQSHLSTFLATHDMMVQPFQHSVTTYSERSLIFIDGELTHAVKRSPELSLEPVQSHQNELATPQKDEIKLAQNILGSVDTPVMYARVDMVRGDNGAIHLLELELVEPSLFLHLAPHAVQRFADAIAMRCKDAA